MFTDLFIESVLMAGLKSTGGLTRGLGFNESTRLLFLLSRPICAEISQSIFEIARLSSRIQPDMSDIDKVLQVFLERGVFSTSSRRLVSLYWISWRLKCKCRRGESRWRQDTRVYGSPTGLELHVFPEETSKETGFCCI